MKWWRKWRNRQEEFRPLPLNEASLEALCRITVDHRRGFYLRVVDDDDAEMVVQECVGEARAALKTDDPYKATISAITRVLENAEIERWNQGYSHWGYVMPWAHRYAD